MERRRVWTDFVLIYDIDPGTHLKYHGAQSRYESFPAGRKINKQNLCFWVTECHRDGDKTLCIMRWFLFVWRTDNLWSLGGRSRLTAKGVVGWSRCCDDHSVLPWINRGLGFMSCSVHSARLQINTDSDLIRDVNLKGDVNMAARNAAPTSFGASDLSFEARTGGFVYLQFISGCCQLRIIASNVKMWWIGKAVEESGRGLF
jgi:hypothetical protein